MLGRARISAAITAAGLCVSTALAGGLDQSVARQWDEQALDAVRVTAPRPPVIARALYHFSAAMYDAWAAYDGTARGVYYQQKHTADDVEAAREEAVSYAAYKVLTARFVNPESPNNPSSKEVLADLTQQMIDLGYDPGFDSEKGDTPAAVGIAVANAVLAASDEDGSNQANDFDPNNGYEPVNEEMVFKFPGCEMDEPDLWQPLAFDFLVLQNGIVIGAAIQEFICPHWANTEPFALRESHRDKATGVYLDPGPPVYLGSEEFKQNAVALIEKNSKLDPSLDEMINISPGALYNNPLGTDDGTGYDVNPATGAPYAPNLVKVADWGRTISEFWADGPDSETPPGHWHVVANDVADTPGFEKRLQGVGPVVDDLEWDIKVYLALAGANHDAAVSAWGCKGHYDYARPISHIRYMAGLGQSSDPKAPHYHEDGLPLVEDLIELVTEDDVLSGGRFEEFPELVYEAFSGEPIGVNTHVGDVAIRAWSGGYNAGAVTLDPAAGATIPGHAYRCDGAWTMGAYAIGDGDTPGAPNGPCTPPGAIVINEVRIAQPGPDHDEYVELAGPPEASLDGYWYVVLGDETPTGVPSPQGRVKRFIDLSGYAIGEDGLFLLAESTFTLGVADATAQLNFVDIENTTHLLVRGFTGYLGQDLDVFDNGTLNFTPWTITVDSISLRDDIDGDPGVYSAVEIGPDQAREQVFGVDWILAETWLPYQASNFVTPPFAGYVSGHSTFSRASAEVMAVITGDPYFPGGLGEYTFEANDWLKFEDGPSEELVLQWATYFDAADEASLSRRWGGIHPVVDDHPGRIMGSVAGNCAVAKALALYQGLANSPDVDCNGVVDGADLGQLLGSWGACSGECASDLNGDGTVDGADLGLMLGQWG